MADIIRNLDWSFLTNMLINAIPALLCITVHEFSHGLAAYMLGDTTAKRSGRLTLNPIKHIDPMGLIMLIACRFGWAKPVPVNMYNFRDPKRGMAITAIAGPVSNLLFACICFFVYGFSYYWLYSVNWGDTFLTLVYATAYINISLAVFNILPIPPLDGSKILFSFISQDKYRALMRYERYGMIILMIIVFTGISGSYLTVAVNYVIDILFPIAEWAFDLVLKFV